MQTVKMLASFLQRALPKSQSSVVEVLQYSPTEKLLITCSATPEIGLAITVDHNFIIEKTDWTIAEPIDQQILLRRLSLMDNPVIGMRLLPVTYLHARNANPVAIMKSLQGQAQTSVVELGHIHLLLRRHGQLVQVLPDVDATTLVKIRMGLRPQRLAKARPVLQEG